jgi:pimeloyl-ACP methyl ester carboxylesterase
MEKPTTSGHAPVNGIQMYYETYGEGEIPLVLIHGGGSTMHTSFGAFIPLIKSYGKLITVDLQAHGRTTDRNAPETFEQDADDVAGLLRYLGIAKASVFGFSNGGTTAMQIAINHPKLVHKIINLAGSSKRSGFPDVFFEGFDNATIDNMPAPYHKAFLEVTPDKNLLQNMFEKDRRRMMNFKDIPDEVISSIKAPALIMVNDKDVVPVEHAAELARLIHNAQLAVFPGYHGQCIGEVFMANPDSRIPEATALLVLEFLRG